MVGEPILLEDARGCWRPHTVTRFDRGDGVWLRLHSAAWATLEFRFVGHDTRPPCPHPLRLFRADKPAIGPNKPASLDEIERLYLPDGWEMPWHDREE